MATDTLPQQPVAEPALKPFEHPEPFQRGLIPRRGGSWGKWWKLPRFIRRFILRDLTPAEKANTLAKREEEDRRKSLERQLRTRAQILANIIPLKLADLNVCYRLRATESRREKVTVIKFERIEMAPDAIYLKIDFRPGKAPIGVGVAQLGDPNVLDALSIACANNVQFEYSSFSGAWYIVELTEGTRGVPADVTWEECIRQRPPRADLMSFPLGRGSGEPEWMSLSGETNSIIVAGTTGAGKSVFLNSFICAMLAFNKPNTLRFCMVDLKGGIELSAYSQIPHLLKIPEPRPFKKRRKVQEVDDDGTLEEHEEIVDDDAQEDAHDRPLVPAMITKRELVPDLFHRIDKIIEYRIKLIRERQPRGRALHNLTEYNNTLPPGARRLPHIILCIDEWANIRLDKEIGAACERVLTNIASQGRAAGVHVVFCTQVPNKAVISTNIKEVLPGRIAFSMPDVSGSMLIVGDGSAVKLSPPGRCIVSAGNYKELIQAPYISNDKIHEIVEMAKAGRTVNMETVRHELTPGEIWEWALKYNDGRLTVSEVYAGLQRRGAKQATIEKIISEHEHQTVIVNQTEYVVMPPAFGVGRILMAKNNVQAQPQGLEPVDDTPEALPPATPAPPPPPAQDGTDAAAWGPATPAPLIGIEQEIVEWAVTTQRGEIRQQEALAKFAGRGTVRYLKSILAGLDGRTFTVGGVDYRVAQPDLQRRTPRRAVAVQPAEHAEIPACSPPENTVVQSIPAPPDADSTHPDNPQKSLRDGDTDAA